jgi:hypothetical protein
MIAEEGKAGRKISERWSAILVSSPTASNNNSPVVFQNVPLPPGGGAYSVPPSSRGLRKSWLLKILVFRSASK